MNITFDLILPLLLKDEGGYVNRKADRGGPTNKGVTWQTYDTYRRGKGLSTRSVRYITMAEVREIYRTMYWDQVKADLLPDHLRYTVFDVGVNSGPSRAIKMLQQCAGVKTDGRLGPITLNAAERVTLEQYSRAREQRYKDIIDADPTQREFERGWLKRVKDVHNRTLVLLEAREAVSRD